MSKSAPPRCADGTLYRLIRSDEFTGVQAVDTATGTEKWRSVQEPWTGNGLAADETAWPICDRLRESWRSMPQQGEERWKTEPPDTAWSLGSGNGRVCAGMDLQERR